MKLYERLRGLPVVIESVALGTLSLQVSSAMRRRTILVRLRGAGEEGQGEDVGFDRAEQDELLGAPDLPLRGEWTLGELGRKLDELPLHARPPGYAGSARFRRWAFESAALDLALRQAGLSLAAALDREPQPVRFVVSRSLGREPSLDTLRALLAQRPRLRYKVDVSSRWSAELVRELAALDRVDVLDFKSAYPAHINPDPAPPELHRELAAALPRALLEDPSREPELGAWLAEHAHRVSWDAPVHSVASYEALPAAGTHVNLKPSRIGRLESLLELYEHCARRGVSAYGGGMFELGPGRSQIQLLAALFHPDAPNDVAPGGYHLDELAPDLPEAPLVLAASGAGFR